MSNCHSFDGSIVNWQSFCDKYQALIRDVDIPAVTKFSYLSSFLEGEARQVIQGLSITASNYGIACELLQQAMHM